MLEENIEQNIIELIEKIKERNVKKILLQLPEGLKSNAMKMIDRLEKAGLEVFLSNDPCYGACDLRDEEAKELGCDLLVHIGHSKFYKDFKTSVPILYYPWPIKALNKIDFSGIKEKRIGLLTNIQHTRILDRMKKELEKYGKKCLVGGNVLGCNVENAEKIKNMVDVFLFVGSGRFHPIGVSGIVYVLDLETRKIEKLDSSFEKRKYANIYKCKDASSFAILLSSKKGQLDFAKAKWVKKFLEEKNKKAYILIMDEINDQKLLGIKVDAFVNTACPRITDEKFSRPIINVEDINKIFENDK